MLWNSFSTPSKHTLASNLTISYNRTTTPTSNKVIFNDETQFVFGARF